MSPERVAEINEVIDRITRWARAREDIVGLLLVGSCARKAARPDSDIDVVLSIPWFRRDLSYAAWHLWSLFLRASVMLRSNSSGGRPPAALCLRRGL
ncbi:nucleotidyltransferase domain-containing protein [Streptomyces marianii]|uniref:Nucleotidyltransferase domain-containing protein n=1 Tax=Streptomyces marianii TaxID=1817406 RepID=A0A5R9EFR3_9ACTN|nr:nucleotidyltransferase domain-containing protein [Streptomyces marianii]